MNKFSTNQIVKGKGAGFFVVLGYRQLCGEQLVQVKLYNPETGKTARGEMALPESALQSV